MFLCVLVAWTYDGLSLKVVPPKQHQDHIRIGYINLNKSKISSEDLSIMRAYNCDIWLFLEWNGNNLDNMPEFTADYSFSFELIDTFTYGVYILSKLDSNSVMEVGTLDRPYACDYPKHQISLNGGFIYLLHAPPPVPTCEFQTEKYITDFIHSASETKSKPSLIFGDLNTLAIQSGVKAIKAEGYADSYNSLHRLPAVTFGPTKCFPKLVKFDYVFHNQYVKPQMLERFSLSNSDHSGYVADFMFNIL